MNAFLIAALTLTSIASTVLSGCGELSGLDEDLIPLATLRVQSKGNLSGLLAPGRDPANVRLRTALVWGAVPAPKRFCLKWGSPLSIGLPTAASLTVVVKAGCSDPLGFTPELAGSGAALATSGHTALDLLYLPSAEVLVGPPEGRTGYGSVVIYDDRNGNGALDLRRSRRHFAPGEDWPGPGDPPQGEGSGGGNGKGGQGPGGNPAAGFDDKTPDEVYGASFVSMLQPHVRVAYREGTFGTAAFYYPMTGCEPPPVGFSVIEVGGTILKASCEVSDLDAAVVHIPLQATQTVGHLACRPTNDRYYDTEWKADLTQPWVCLSENELVVANPPGPCKGITSFLLKGCFDTAACEEPDWDQTDNPPEWWPCLGVEAIDEDEK